MPRPRGGENQSDFVARAIPMLKKEGHSQLEAVGKAHGMWEYYSKQKKRKK